MQTTIQTDTVTVKITPNDKGNPPGKLADAELHFADGPLAGLKLIGFAIWERRGGGGRNVTFPARQYSVNGERRSFALLRPVVDTTRPGRGARPHPRGVRRVRAGAGRRRVVVASAGRSASGAPSVRQSVGVATRIAHLTVTARRIVSPARSCRPRGRVRAGSSP